MHSQRHGSRKGVAFRRGAYCFDKSLAPARGAVPPPIAHTIIKSAQAKLGSRVERPIISPMLIRRAPDLRYSDITPKSLYLRRREFLREAAAPALGSAAAAPALPLPTRTE